MEILQKSVTGIPDDDGDSPGGDGDGDSPGEDCERDSPDDGDSPGEHCDGDSPDGIPLMEIPLIGIPLMETVMGIPQSSHQ